MFLWFEVFILLTIFVKFFKMWKLWNFYFFRLTVFDFFANGLPSVSFLAKSNFLGQNNWESAQNVVAINVCCIQWLSQIWGFNTQAGMYLSLGMFERISFRLEMCELFVKVSYVVCGEHLPLYKKEYNGTLRIKSQVKRGSRCKTEVKVCWLCDIQIGFAEVHTTEVCIREVLQQYGQLWSPPLPLHALAAARDGVNDRSNGRSAGSRSR